MNRVKVLILFGLVIVSINFFESRYLTATSSFKNPLLYFRYACFCGMIVISLPYALRKSRGFVLPVQLLFLSMVVSIFMAYNSWDQSLMKSFLATVPYMIWIFFFYLLEAKVPIRIVENIVLVYGMMYVLLFVYQFTHAATPFFGSSDEFDETRGVVRIIFPGGGVFYLASFIAINRLTTEGKKLIWLGIAMLGLACTVMQVTRQAIAGVCLIYFYHFLKDMPVHKKIIALVVVVIGIGFFLSSSNNPIVKGLTEAQKSDASEGKNYIRVVAATFFLNDFSPNSVSRVLGNGVPYALDSNYAIYVANLKERGFFLSDLGIIAMYIMFGIISVIAFVLIWIKSFTIRVPKQYQYVKYYLWYLLITCITANYIYDSAYLITTVFALYIYQAVYEESKEMAITPDPSLQLT